MSGLGAAVGEITRQRDVAIRELAIAEGLREQALEYANGAYRSAARERDGRQLAERRVVELEAKLTETAASLLRVSSELEAQA